MSLALVRKRYLKWLDERISVHERALGTAGMESWSNPLFGPMKSAHAQGLREAKRAFEEMSAAGNADNDED